MSKRKRTSALLSAMVMACCTANAVMPAGANASEGKFPESIRTNVSAIDITSDSGKIRYDLNNDGKCDYYDVYEAESVINQLYQNTGTAYYTKINNDTEVTEFNMLSIADLKNTQGDEVDYDKYDINDDDYLSPDDYCSYLKVLSDQFKFTVSINETTNTNLNATITGLNDGVVLDNGTLAVPAEIYDADSDRILPVSAVDYGAFQGNKAIKRVEFIDYRQPDWYDGYGNPITTRGQITASTSLTIRDNAFADCSALTEVVLPQNVTVEKDAFTGTPFFDANNNEEKGIKTLTGSPDKNNRITVIAYDIDPDAAIDEDGTLTIPANVTAVSQRFMCDKVYKKYPNESDYVLKASADKLKRLVFEKDSSGNYNINYLGEDAFSGCMNLVTVNGTFFSYNDDYMKDLMYRYISSFNSTRFMAIKTEKEIRKIAAKIISVAHFDEMNEAEKALVAAKYLLNNTYYSLWDTKNTQFSLYPNGLYQTIDIARGAYESENAALNVRFTECAGISKAYALVLDSIGVKNFTMGAPGHALNQVYLDGKWYTIDLSGYCGDRADEIMKKSNSNIDFRDYRDYDDSITIDLDDAHNFTYSDNCDSEIVKKIEIKNDHRSVICKTNEGDKNILDTSQNAKATLTTNSFFDLYESSAGKHINTEKDLHFIYNADRTKLMIFACGAEYDHEKVKELVDSLTESNVFTAEDTGVVIFREGHNKIIGSDYALEVSKDDVQLTANGFNNNTHKYYNGEGKAVYSDWVDIGSVNYYINGVGMLVFTKGDDEVTAKVYERNGKYYVSDFYGHLLDGEYTCNGHTWTFMKGEVITTDAIICHEWYHAIDGKYFKFDKNGKVILNYKDDPDTRVEGIVIKRNVAENKTYFSFTDGTPLTGTYVVDEPYYEKLYTWEFDENGLLIDSNCI